MPRLRVQMRIEIAKLHHSLDATMIYVTHDQVEAMTLADRIVVLEAGYVKQFGSPLDLYHHPDNKFVAGFIGSPKMNFLPAELLSGGDDSEIRLPQGGVVTSPIKTNGAQTGDGYEIGIRPEHLIEGGGGDATIKGPIITVEHLGAETYLYLDMGQEMPLVVKSAGNSQAKWGEEVEVGIPAGACYLFDKDERCYPRTAFE